MSEKIQILLVEDDTNLGFVIKDVLKEDGFDVHLATDGKEGLNTFSSATFDLCLLDVMMPKKDGFSLAEDIRKMNQEIPIVFLTAKGMSQDKIKGFQVGGDDYITKPFSSEELVLRIRAILKRNPKVAKVSTDVATLGLYQVDYKNFSLVGPITQRKLTKKECDLLRILIQHQGQVMERELLANMVWGDDTYFVGRSMDVFITRLRKYLSDDPSISIVNIHGVGFKLSVS